MLAQAAWRHRAGSLLMRCMSSTNSKLQTFAYNLRTMDSSVLQVFLRERPQHDFRALRIHFESHHDDRTGMVTHL